MTLKRLCAMAVVVLGMLAFASPAWAETYTVTNNNDSGDGSLRAALTSAVADQASDGVVQFGPAVRGEIVLTSELPALDDVEIVGPGEKELTVRRSSEQGTPEFGIFTVASDVTVKISGLTISGGSSANGGGISNELGTVSVSDSTISGNSASSYGGGIHSAFGPVSVSNSTISGNSSSYGGGINSTHMVNVSNSTISGNSASEEGGGLNIIGKASVSNSTVSGNSSSYGGGIYNIGTASVSNSTISGNSASEEGGGICIGSDLTVKSSIVVGNSAGTSGPDVRGDLASGSSFNLIGGTASEAGLETDQSGKPLLEDNGGPTPTIALLSGSPAIDKGNAFGLTADQRGETRPQDASDIANAEGGDGSDIGAFEVGLVSISDATVTEGDSGTTEADFTVRLPEQANQTVSVDYATEDGTATSSGPSADYQTTSGTLNFSSGEIEKTITVPVNGDNLDEPDETFSVVLSSVQGMAGILDRPGIGTITDDDDPPSLSVGDVSVTEGDTGTKDATFTATLSAASGKEIRLDYATQDDTATSSGPSADYQTTSGTLNFSSGETEKTITVPVNGDNLDEPDETFFLNLTNPSNVTPDDMRGVGTILNDDATPTALADSYTTMAGNMLVVGAPGVLGNDTDADADGLSAINLDEPDNGVLSFKADGSFRYAPDPGFVGTDSFTYEVSDGANESIATVTITVRDETAPTVTSTTPKAGARIVKDTANVTTTFSEPIDRSSLSDTTFTLKRRSTGDVVEATLGYASSQNRAILNPTDDLVAGAAYTVTVKGGPSGIADTSATPLAEDRTWTFSVNSPPRIEVLDPAPGTRTTNLRPPIRAVVKDLQSTLSASNITLEIDGVEVSSFTYNRSTGVLRFVPSGDLAYGRHKVTIGAIDPQGLSSSRTWYFSVVR